jgi:hypothetical protein
MREAADEGSLVVSLQSENQADTHYHHLSFVRYQPLRPVLLRMVVAHAHIGADASELGAKKGKLLLRPAHALVGHWAFALDCSAYSWVDLQKPQTLRLLRIQNTTLSKDGFVLEVRPFQRGERLIWRGHIEKAPDRIPWEVENSKHKEDEERTDCESSSGSTIMSDGEQSD